jgi:hypothetical protein
MLVYKHTKNPEQNSLPSFDWERFERAAQILEAPIQTGENKKNNPKNLLIDLASLWKKADQTLKNRSKPPEELPKKAATLVKSLENLQKSHFRSLNLPFRIRGENQLRALKTNGFNPETQEIRVCLTQLQNSIEQAESTGKITLEIPCENPLHTEEMLALPESQQTKPPTLVFQNELQQRPETKRIWSGDYTHMAAYKAKKYQTNAAQEVLTLGGLFSGPRVTLSKKIQVEQASIKTPTTERQGLTITPESCQEVAQALKNKKWLDRTTYKAHVPEFVTPQGALTEALPRPTVELTLRFPEIVKKIEEHRAIEQKTGNGPDENTKSLRKPGEGTLTDGALRLHTAELYGCNGRQFVKSLPRICSALFNDLNEATLTWFGKKDHKAAELNKLLLWLEKNATTVHPIHPRDLENLPSAGRLLNLQANPLQKKTRKEQFLVDLLFNNKKVLPQTPPAGQKEEDLPPKSLSDALSGLAPELLISLEEIQTPTKPNAEEVQRFLQEYTLIALTLTNTPKTAQDLGPNLTLQDPQESLASNPLSSEAKYSHEPFPNQETEPLTTLTDSLEDEEAPIPKTKPKRSLIDESGQEWRNSLIQKEIEKELLPHPTRDELLKSYTISNVEEKREAITRNLYLQTLDNTESTLTLQTPAYTNLLIEDFTIQKELREQEEFESKSERLPVYDGNEDKPLFADEFHLEKWLLENAVTELELPNKPYLLHRMTQYSAPLRAPLTAAERHDPEISLPVQKNDKKLKKEDFFAPGLREAIQKASEPGPREALKTFDSMVDVWQTPHQSHSPLQYQIQNWIQKLKNDPQNPALQIQSEAELQLLTCPLLQTTGRYPKNSEKTPDWMQRPHISSPLALELLCGVPQQDVLNNLKQDPQKLWDAVIRWSNAAQGHQHPTPYKKDRHVELLSQTPLNELTNHALQLEIETKPNFLRAYLEEKGILTQLLPTEYKPLEDCLLPISNCPNTIDLQGEETPIEEIISHLKLQQVELTPPPPSIEEAPEKALASFLDRLSLVQKNLLQLDAPSGKPTTVRLTLAEGENAIELQEILGSQYNQNLKNSLALGEALLTHNPSELTIQTETDSFTFKKGSNNSWVPKNPSDNPQEALIQNSLSEALQLLEDPQNPEVTQLREDCQTKRLLLKLPHLLEAIQTVPPTLAKLHKNTLEPLTLLAKQIIKAEEVAQKGLSAIQEWTQPTPNGEDGNWKDKTQTAEILDAIQTQKDPETALGVLERFAETTGWTAQKTTPPNPLDKTQTLSQKLFTKEKLEYYSQKLLETGRIPTGLEIEKNLKKEIEKIQATYGKELLGGWKTLLQTLEETLDLGKNEKTKTFFRSSYPSLLIAKDRALKAHYAPQILSTLTKNPNLFPSTRTPLRALAKNQELQTNRLWAKAWLTKEKTQTRLLERENLARWLKTAKPHGDNSPNSMDQIRTNVAFLELCQHQTRFHIAPAIKSGSLTPTEKENLQKALQLFSRELENLGIAPSAPLNAKIHGAFALHTLSKKSKDPRTKLTWITELLGEGSPATQKTQDTKRPLSVSLLNDASSGVALQNPFQERGERYQESPQDLLTGAQKAVGILFKPVAYKKKGLKKVAEIN